MGIRNFLVPGITKILRPVKFSLVSTQMQQRELWMDTNPVCSRPNQNPRIAYTRLDIYGFINDRELSPLSQDEDTMEIVGRVKLMYWN